MSRFQWIVISILGFMALVVLAGVAAAILFLMPVSRQATAPAPAAALPAAPAPTATPLPTPTPGPPNLGNREDIRDALIDIGITNWERHTDNSGQDDAVGISNDELAVIRLRNDPVTLARLAIDPLAHEGGKILNTFLIETTGPSEEILAWLQTSDSTNPDIPNTKNYADIKVSHYFDLEIGRTFIEVEIR